MKRKITKILGIGLTLALLTSLLVTATPVMAATGPQFLDVVPFDVTTGEWSTTVEATTPQSGDYSYHVVLPANSAGAGLDIIHKNIYGPTGVGTMTLPDITSMTFWEYVKVPGGPNNLGAGITLYLDMNDDGVFLWADDVQIVLESPYNDPLVTEHIGEWALRDITNFAGFQKGGTGLLGNPFTGVDGITLENSPWALWQTSAYATYPVLWVGIVAGWGDYGSYDGYFDDFIINGDTYVLEPRVINTTTPAGFSNIQDAIDAATAGDTIIANDGTYTEDLTVTIADLTIKSETGKANTTIQLVDGVGIDIQAGASGFTLGGAENEGFIILSGATTFNIQVVNAPSGVEVSYNTINTTGDASQGISVGAAGASGLTVSNNAFTAEVGDISIWSPDVVNLTVSDNTFTGPGSTANGVAVEPAGATGTSTISGNTISGYGTGVWILSGGPAGGTTGVNGLTISGNTVSSCAKGITLGHNSVTSDMTTVTVTNNTITNNTTGLYISDGIHVLASNFAINYNSFVGNFAPTTGLANSNAEEVDAENNWWGSASGPSGEGPGLGDAVSVNVDFTPWLLSEGGEPVVTYTDYISVPDGWSLISPNVAWADWDALGSDLVLTYDTSLLVPAFVEPQSSSLSPLTAIYVKTTGGGLLGMNYPDYDLGMYATNLEVGWNLIGIPETNAEPGAILSPLRYGVNNETALATLASQGNYNPSAETFYEDAFTWANIEGLTLDASDGYWAYMNVAKEFGVVVVPASP